MRHKIAAAVLLSFLSVKAQVQNPKGQDVQTLRGVVPTSSYSVSDLDTINTTNGNLLLHLPIVSLPAGRAGHSAGISLIYNSKVYDTSTYGDIMTNGNCVVAADLVASEDGGWKLAFGYSLRVRMRPSSCGDDLPISACDPEQPAARWRYELIFPDGSVHALIPVGLESQGAVREGYFNVEQTGITYNCTVTYSGTPPVGVVNQNPVGVHSLWFYTNDGTFARVKLVPSDESNWTLYFADGRMVRNIPQPSSSALTMLSTSSSLAAGAVGRSYLQGLAAAGGAGVYQSLRWSLVSGALPPGLQLQIGGPFGGLITGTPTTTGTYNFTLKVTDTVGTQVTGPQMTLTINGGSSLGIVNSLADSQTIGTSTVHNLTAVGGTGPYTWSVVGGLLPPSVTLSTAGVLSGSLSELGNYNFTVRVTDAASATATGIFSFAVVDPAAYKQYLFDKNGNAVTVERAFNPSTVIATTTLTDDVGRYVSVDSNWTVTATGGNGTPLQWTVTRSTLQGSGKYSHYAGTNSDPLARPASDLPEIPVVTQVQLPVSLGGGSYKFDYNGAPQSPFTPTTAYWGELRTVTLPSSATVAYQYVWDALPAPHSVLDSAPNNVKAKTTAFGGQTQEVWGYQISPVQVASTGPQLGSSQVTAPDGGITTETYWYGFAVKTVLPDQTTIERRWNINPPYQPAQSGLVPACCISNIIYNPYVAIEYRSIAAAGAPVRTATTEYQQDKNGNVVDTIEHDFVDFGALAPTRVDGIATGAPGTVMRETAMAYYVPTASTGNSCTAGFYCDPNAPRTGKSLRSRKVMNGSQVPLAYTEFDYDDRTGTANLTQEARWDTSKSVTFPATLPLTLGNSIVTHTTYTAHGNVETSTDPRGKVKQFNYGTICGATDLYPTSLVLPLGLTTQFLAYDCNLGLASTVRDPNGVQTVSVYDAAGRTTQTTQAGVVIADRTFHDPTPSAPAVYTIGRTYLDGNKQRVVVQRFDPLYRPSLTQELEAPEPGNIGTNLTVGIKTDHRYSFTTAGNFDLVSNPYRDTAEGTMGWTLISRDTMGRVNEVRSYAGAGVPTGFPGGSNSLTSGKVTNTYAAEVTTVTDQNSVTRQLTSDRLGRLKQVQEAGSATTLYEYDLLDNLTKVTQTGDHGPVIRNFEYTSLGRLATADNPETQDPNSPGRKIVYGYDDNGNLTFRRDTRLTVTNMGYDDLNRLQSKNYTSGANTAQTPNVVYCYDGNSSISDAACIANNPSIPNALGRLTSMSSSVSATQYLEYDSFGRVLKSRQRTGSDDFDFTYTYNRAGTLTSTTYPRSNLLVEQTYDDAGRINSTTGTLASVAVAGASVPSSGFAPHGAITTLNLNNGVAETTLFNARLQPLTITAKVGTATRLGLQFNYCSDFSDINAQQTCNTNNGNIWRQKINFDALGAAPAFNETQSYGYDGFNRLTTAKSPETGTPTWSQPNAYDAVGNRWVNNPTGLPSNTQTPALSSWFLASNRINGWTYDEMGNVLGVGGMERTFVYDAENRQVQATINGRVSTYTYDGDGRRVIQTTPGPDTQTYTTRYVYDAAGQLAQEYSGAPPADTGVGYLTVDHLGSTRLVTDATGGVKRRYDYLPFGEELLVGGRTTAMGYNDGTSVGLPDKLPLKFTSKERDSETGLDFFGARYFSGAQGRFTSADAVFADQQPTDPQSWNLYGYGRNNPLKNVDPNGRGACGVTVSNCWDYFIGGAGAVVNSLTSNLINAPNRLFDYVVGRFNGGKPVFGDVVPDTFTPSNDDQRQGQDAANKVMLVSPAAELAGAKAAEILETGVKVESLVPKSIPAGPSARPTAAQQRAINEMGNTHGCTTCGATSPGTASGNWVGDHQPSTALNPPGGAQVYQPQCLQCSLQQGGRVSAAVKAAKKAAEEAAKKAPRP